MSLLIAVPEAASRIGVELIGMAEAGLAAIEPRGRTAQAIALDGDAIVIGGERLPAAGVRIIAFGKAAPAMTAGALDVVGHLPHDGLIVTNQIVATPDGLEMIVGGHPIPTAGSHDAGRRALDLAATVPDGWVVLYLVSGGGSSLMALPVDEVSVDEMAMLTDHLLRCGADIRQLNTVRRHLSRVKGGRLGAATTAPFATLALSDVVGSEPAAIASGPTVPCTSDPSDALAILDRHAQCIDIPASILAALAAPTGPPPPAMPYVVIGDGAQAAAAAAAAHHDSTVISTSLVGEAREAAQVAVDAVPAGTIGVFAGETVVTVTGQGLGGRNQEAALSAAIAIDGLDVTVLAMGTDGIDGPTPAAGAIVDGTTAGRARDRGVDLQAALDDNDSHHILTDLGCTIVTGATGTNAGDLWLIARGMPESEPGS